MSKPKSLIWVEKTSVIEKQKLACSKNPKFPSQIASLRYFWWGGDFGKEWRMLRRFCLSLKERGLIFSSILAIIFSNYDFGRIANDKSKYNGRHLD